MGRLRRLTLNFNPLISLAIALLIGAGLLALSGYSPWQAYGVLIKGAFGSAYAIEQTLNRTIPLIFSGLAVAVALKGGLFNIGVEGQIYMGGAASALTGIYVTGLPAPLHIVLCLAAGMAAGALWAFIPAILKVKRGAHEVVTTIMLNYVAILFTNYMVNYPFKAPGMTPQTVKIAETAIIPKLFSGSQLSSALIIALITGVFIHLLLKYTTTGYELIATGEHARVAEAGGVRTSRVQVNAMLISGALAGIGGAVLIMGTYGKLIQGFSPGYGYDGIAVAVMGGGSPLGVLFGSLLFGLLRTGGLALDRTTDIPSEFVVLLQGVVIIVISAPSILSMLWKKRRV